MKAFPASIALWLASPYVMAAVQLDVTQFGAVGDGKTVNTVAVQRAVDECNQRGGGIVRIPAGRFVSGTILLKDNVTLRLDRHAFGYR
jgi:polygalacturonase